jgi:carbon-monoxide dehydrogenase iron sulfur subunit
MVVVQEDRCIACWTCTMFCPYGVIYPWPERKFALKCDRCIYMENPVCVEVCPCKALELVDLEDFEEILQQRRDRVVRELAGGNRKGLLVLDLD